MSTENAAFKMRTNGARRARLLVVEDARDTRRLLEHLLRRSYAADVVATPEEALAMAAAERYDALVIDINLGHGMNGEELLARFRENPFYAHVPALALTAYAMPGDRERFLEAGFDAYLAKPFTTEALHTKLHDALQD